MNMTKKLKKQKNKRKNEKNKMNKNEEEERKKNEEIWLHTRKILDDFQGLPLLLSLRSMKSFTSSMILFRNVSFSVRYTSLTTRNSHDCNNHRTSKHASTSWRSDGSQSCLGWSSHGGSRSKPHSTPVPTSVGRLWVAH